MNSIKNNELSKEDKQSLANALATVKYIKRIFQCRKII